MSSAESKSTRSPNMGSSQKAQTDSQQSPSSHVPSSAETLPAETMDQHSDSALIAPLAPPTSPEVMSSTAPDPADIAVNLPNPSPIAPSQPPSQSQSPDILQAHTDEVDADTANSDGAETAEIMRQQPIPPASEPMQYRAIGLVRGKYVPSDEQFTRGLLVADDGVSIDAVLLGRVMSLVKKHLDLEQSHLWVVYPRTREKEYDLHVQIVGVWEPENLSQTELAEGESADETVAGESADETAAAAAVEEPSDLDDRYFSVRGEVVMYLPESEQVLVKIRRIQRQADKQSKAFKVVLRGVLEGNKSVGYFWDFNVQRQGNILDIQSATLIKMVPPQKGEGGSKPRGGPRRGGFSPPGRKRWNGDGSSAPAPRREGGMPPRPSRPQGDRPAKPAIPRERKEPTTKPILKRREQDSSES